MKIIIGNWKMNGDKELAREFVKKLNNIDTANNIAICPPTELIAFFDDFKYKIGAQNCYIENNGAFTGETSPESLKKLGCKYVIIGHSERRTILSESNEFIFKKWKSVCKAGLTPILCVGEQNKDNWTNELTRQLGAFSDEDLNNTIIAYEPVWCIGTGVSPTIDKISEVLNFIRKIISKSEPKVLYGGSVNTKNYQEILGNNNVDGVLIGGASLKIDAFSQIMQYAG